jgi:hypothetical protein
MRILWELLLCKLLSDLLILPLFPIDNFRKDSMTHHNQVDSTTQREETYLDICIKKTRSRAIEPGRLAV